MNRLRELTDNALGAANPHLKHILVTTITKGKKVGTKKLYAGLINQFKDYCALQQVPVIDPFNPKSLNVYAVMYWYTQKVFQLRNCNSIGSWSASLSWLCQGLSLECSPPEHHKHRLFKPFEKDLIHSWKIPSVEKCPVSVHQIVGYLRDALGIVPGRLETLPYENVIRAFRIVLIFIGMYRAAEVSYKKFTDSLDGITTEWETGLRFRHVTEVTDESYRGGGCLRFEVLYWKCQIDDKHPLIKYLSSPCCGLPTSECLCGFFDIHDYLRVIKWMRARRRIDPRPFNNKRSKKPLSPTRYKNLGIGPDDWLFTNRLGHRMTYDTLRVEMQELSAFFNLEGDRKITPHCLRCSL